MLLRRRTNPFTPHSRRGSNGKLAAERKRAMKQDIPGTTLFDGDQAQKGLALNRMCFSFNSADSRAAFLKDEEGYCRKFGLTEEQRAAVKSRNVLAMIAVGGNVYYLAKLAGIFGLNVQDIGAQQTGTTVDQFKEQLAAAGR
jgi:protocatechuate 4,5-dioxygenase alpha chain